MQMKRRPKSSKEFPNWPAPESGSNSPVGRNRKSRPPIPTPAGAIVPDGLLEIWQANSHGRYNHPEDRRNLPLDPGFEGFGRASTDASGCARFGTVRPGRVPWPAGGLQAAHVNISVFARGVLNRLATRLYFDGDPALAEDPVLKLVDPSRRATLIATRDQAGVWRLPLYLGGPNETVFFDV